MKKVFLFTVMSILFLNKNSGASGLKAMGISDTLYILLKSDSVDKNIIMPEIDSSSFSIYGFIRDNKPKDWLDSLDYLAMYVYLEKDLLWVCDACSCKRYLKSKMISLYDLRDTLKHYVMVFKGRRESAIDVSPLLERKTVVLVTESNSKYYMRKVKYLDGFTRVSD